MKFKIIAALFVGLSFGAMAAEKTQDLNAGDFGEDWPLTFENAKVSCVNKMYAFVYDKDTDDRYPLNGMAKDAVKSGKMEGSNLDDVWKDSPDYDGVKISISPLIEAATALCD